MRSLKLPSLGRRDRFPLLSLPREICSLIYLFALVADDPIHIKPSLRQTTRDLDLDPGRNSRSQLRRRKPSFSIGLLRTCREINAEAAHLFYSRNKFSCLQFHSVNWAYLEAWLRQIGDKNVSSLTCVTVAKPTDTGYRLVFKLRILDLGFTFANRCSMGGASCGFMDGMRSTMGHNYDDREAFQWVCRRLVQRGKLGVLDVVGNVNRYDSDNGDFTLVGLGPKIVYTKDNIQVYDWDDMITKTSAGHFALQMHQREFRSNQVFDKVWIYTPGNRG